MASLHDMSEALASIAFTPIPSAGNVMGSGNALPTRKRKLGDVDDVGELDTGSSRMEVAVTVTTKAKRIKKDSAPRTTASKLQAAQDALEHLTKHLAEHHDFVPCMTTDDIALTQIFFEPVSSIIQTRLPHRGPFGLHIYIPTCSIKVVTQVLRRVMQSLTTTDCYEVEEVLGFIGRSCWCGGDHWHYMGLRVAQTNWKWPEDLATDRNAIGKAVCQLGRERRMAIADV